MPSKPRYLSSEKDDLVWLKLDEDSDAWYESVRTSETYREVAKFMSQYYKDAKAVELHSTIRGGYNVVYRLEFQDGRSLIMRVPIKGITPTCMLTAQNSELTVQRRRRVPR